MKITPSQTARLEFLVRVTDKECQHLLDTDGRLFGNLFTIEEAQKIEADPILAERLDAFVSRFGRLQDTVGDKLLPALLTALAEKTGPAIDNLDKCEKFGFIESADGWMEMHRLRNQMVHEYIGLGGAGQCPAQRTRFCTDPGECCQALRGRSATPAAGIGCSAVGL
jgi:hypothetical protein